MDVREYATIPSDDEDFRRIVGELAREVDDVDRLREVIKGVYPEAEIAVQDPLGTLPGSPLRVYIYRQGRTGPPGQGVPNTGT